MGLSAHLFYRELFEFRQRAGQQPHQEGGGTADDVQHGGWQHGDERVLPGERVEQRHNSEHAAGQGAEDGRQNKMSEFKLFYSFFFFTWEYRKFQEYQQKTENK